MLIRIATWNMAFWTHKNLIEEAWDYLTQHIDADYYFFQEAKPVNTLLNDTKHLIWNEIGNGRPWGSGIYTKRYDLSEEIIKTDFKGAVSIANSTMRNHKLTLISLYGLMESKGPTKGYAITNLHRMLSDLTGIFNGHTGGRRSIILGGDLNASVQLDPLQKNNSHKIFFERLEDFGLNDCFKLSKTPYPIQTLRHPKSKVKWQNDYFFISKNIAHTLTKCEVIDNEKIRIYSDHNPVIISLDL